jgi:hypothetical protein
MPLPAESASETPVSVLRPGSRRRWLAACCPEFDVGHSGDQLWQPTPAATCCKPSNNQQDMTDDQKRYETERHALFFKEEACKQLYKDHVAAITGRVNSYNGLK